MQSLKSDLPHQMIYLESALSLEISKSSGGLVHHGFCFKTKAMMMMIEETPEFLDISMQIPVYHLVWQVTWYLVNLRILLNLQIDLISPEQL